ncbi:uncharacterized protein LOC133327696 [Musca vetustissima]|uniref:uncharacterized protein LOC133327696 n=1 Tax=Musca vetustissima TaxID=27455 RepID=UPI002AB62D61|nr:uncharacterized protein LOC133327696 [Musca vetustissima]
MRGVTITIITILVAMTHGYNYDRYSSTTAADDQSDDIQRISEILHPSASSHNSQVQKDIFTFSPPELDVDDDNVNVENTKTSSKKRFRIIFIRSPDQSREFAQNLAHLVQNNISEEKTIIYVLRKQPDLSELTQQLEEIKHENRQKPEVKFIKYRNAAEAEHAVKSIQTSYEQLGGRTQHHGAVVAPVVRVSSQPYIK